MNVKNMIALSAKYGCKLSDYDKLVLGGKSAVSMRDGDMRWLEMNQEIQFCEPRFFATNIEFSIVGNPFQKIWFSQLSSLGVSDDFKSPLMDEIVFKDQEPCLISKRYKTAADFWNDVRGKTFRVEIIGLGYALNRDNVIVNSLRQSTMSEAMASDEKTEKRIFDYIRKEVEYGDKSNLSGVIKYKKAYRLIEI